jgi:acylphosphatase
MAEACRRCYVRGRVQGVGFRASARHQGLVLGLAVRARNLNDGSVEIIARGEEPALDALCEWLRSGPRLARVDEVRCEPLAQANWPVFDED